MLFLKKIGVVEKGKDDEVVNPFQIKALYGNSIYVYSQQRQLNENQNDAQPGVPIWNLMTVVTESSTNWHCVCIPPRI